MYAVIFRAEVKQLDKLYGETAHRMRELAMNQYGCSEFVAVMEGSQEIAISYWKELSDITAWKQDAEHLVAQTLGRSTWYQSYQVEVVEVIRSYKGSS